MKGGFPMKEETKKEEVKEVKTVQEKTLEKPEVKGKKHLKWKKQKQLQRNQKRKVKNGL